ncbi:MAG: tetratricopeptide repeat protein [Anaerolineales bacterium]|nr:tetratricopeptide repeat protein [Anaerolineales bacterium]
MRSFIVSIMLASAFTAGCATRSVKTATTAGTLAQLHNAGPGARELGELEVDQGLDQAMRHYRRFLEETPETTMTPEAMRRLADLQLEKQFGIHTDNAGPRESDPEFERRTTAGGRIPADGGDAAAAPPFSPGNETASAGPLEAIALYNRLLTEYPRYEDSDRVLYQMARAYDEIGRTEEAMEAMDRLVRANPHSEHLDEVQFRRGEFFFTHRKYLDAESAYSAIIELGDESPYYELALYKLGWAFYKQELYEEALDRYMALLDYKLSTGYDFDETHEVEEERRVEDTFRVISLSFTNLGGPEAVPEYFSSSGNRPYEDRIYRNLGEHFLAKLRYDDAAKTFRSFIRLYPFHRAAPHFSMKVVETFTKGGFPMLVLESKREFASRYGLQAEYWRHVSPEDSPEALLCLKTNLKDLATHYHAEYQSAGKEDEKLASYGEAIRWYGDYLESFPSDGDSPEINCKLADLLFENGDFGDAAGQYERTAYEYPPHSQSAEAGYAAVYAYRRQLSAASEQQREAVRRDAVASSLRFADAFPEHEQAAAVLGAAADDLYGMKDYRTAVDSARRVIASYPDSGPALQQSAWLVTAHGSFELGEYAEAERAYARVLAAVPESDESRSALVENLAASVYRQGELANEAQDFRAAADHFLRVRSSAPESGICAASQYDAGAALIRLRNWKEAVSVFDTFRREYPEHELRVDATRQIAFAYREDGQLPQSAGEYERLASESEDPALRGDALLAAGGLYEESGERDGALRAYNLYVHEFPGPIETALETRNRIAGMYRAANEESLYLRELERIVSIDADAGTERTGRTRTLAARASLVLAEHLYRDYAAVKLRQPFEASLQEKQQGMNKTIEAMSLLVDYEIADVTAAATYYMAETYFDFSRSLMDSERPEELEPEELEAFEMNLDETAFPFEEKAINVHEKNIEMLRAGVFNEWTEKSLGRLTELMPGRYAKQEMSGGFLGAIDSYVYRSPAARNSMPEPGRAGALPEEPERAADPEPMAANKGGEKHAHR